MNDTCILARENNRFEFETCLAAVKSNWQSPFSRAHISFSKFASIQCTENPYIMEFNMKRLLAFVAVLSVMIGGTIHLSLLDHFMYTQMAMAAIMNHPNFNSPFLRPESMARGPVVESKPSQRKPLNILVIYPDDWRHDSIGGVGPVVQTPFLNTLARKGIRFTHNCVTTSICWISRASYFTGQYASRHKSMRLREPQFYKSLASAGILSPTLISNISPGTSSDAG